MHCNRIGGKWLVILALVAFFVIAWNVVARSAIRTHNPSIYFVDFAEATLCDQTAVYAAGEDEIALVFMSGNLGDTSLLSFASTMEPSIGVYIYAEASKTQNGDIRLDGTVFRNIKWPKATSDQVRNGDLIMVRINSAGKLLEVVNAKHIDGMEYFTTPRGARAVEIYGEYKRALMQGVAANGGNND